MLLVLAKKCTVLKTKSKCKITCIELICLIAQAVVTHIAVPY
jgi:hypothetical protein